MNLGQLVSKLSTCWEKINPLETTVRILNWTWNHGCSRGIQITQEWRFTELYTDMKVTFTPKHPNDIQHSNHSFTCPKTSPSITALTHTGQ